MGYILSMKQYLKLKDLLTPRDGYQIEQGADRVVVRCETKEAATILEDLMRELIKSGAKPKPRAMMSKTVSRRALLRSYFIDEPAASALEITLVEIWECERPLFWAKLLVEAEKYRILDTVQDALIYLVNRGLLEFTKSGEGLIVPEDRMQEAMDIAGIWYDPYPVGTGEEAYRLTEKGKRLLEESSDDDI